MATANPINNQGSGETREARPSRTRNSRKVTGGTRRRNLNRSETGGEALLQTAATDNWPQQPTSDREYYDQLKNRLKRQPVDNEQAPTAFKQTRVVETPSTKTSRKQKQLLRRARQLKKSAVGRGEAFGAARTATATASIILGTIWIYLIQIFLGTFTLLGAAGLGYINTDWWYGLADSISFGTLSEAGLSFYIVGVAGTLVCSIVIALIAGFTYSVRGVKIMGGLSLLVLTLCFCLHVLPFFNMLPLVWFWCFYLLVTSRKFER